MTDTATTPTETSDLGVNIEDAGPALKRLTITIPPATISEKIESSLGTMASQAALPGFRKGRAPRALVERRFGTSVRQETKNQIVAEAYSQALEDHKIKPISDPTPVTPLEELNIVDGKSLEFTVEVEVVPEFELPALDDIEIKKPMIDVTDERVEHELKRQCTLTGTPGKIDGDFKEGDRLSGRIEVRKEGEDAPIFHNDQGVMVVPPKSSDGKGQVYGIPVENMTNEFKGKRVGDTLSFNAKGPEQHEIEAVRGADLTVSFEIRSAERVEPASIEQVVAHYGLGTEENLREQIKLALEYRRDQEQADAMRDQVSQHLVSVVDFPLPERLTGAQAGRAIEKKRLDLLYMGLNPEEVEAHLADIRSESEEAARRRLKVFFIVHKLSEQFKIEVNEQEVNGRIAAIAAQRGVRPEKLRAELQQSGRINEIASQLREHKAFDRVIASAKVSEIPGDEWNKAVEGGKSTPAAAKKKTSKSTGKKTSKKKKSASKK